MRGIKFYLIFYFSLPLFLSAEEQNLGALLEYALENNPEIQMAYYSWQIQKANKSLKTSLPDPKFKIGLFILFFLAPYSINMQTHSAVDRSLSPNVVKQSSEQSC